MKKIICSIVFIIAILLVGINLILVNASADNRVLFINKDEIEIGSTVLLNVDLSAIDYTKSNIKIYSSESIANVEQNNINNVAVYNNEIAFDFDKSASNINNCIFEIKLSDTVGVGTLVTFKIEVKNLEDDTLSFEEEKNIRIKDVETTTTVVTSNVKTPNTNTAPQKQNNNKSNFTNVASSNIDMSNVNIEENTPNVYNGSTNNYLKKLSVSGYSFTSEFKKETSSYFITVPSDVKKIKVNASSEDSKAIVQISGNTDLKTGINKVLISVTSKSGSTRYYRIYVTKEES